MTIMIVKTFRSQVGSPVAAGKEGEMMGGGGRESGKLQRRVVRSKPRSLFKFRVFEENSPFVD